MKNVTEMMRRAAIIERESHVGHGQEFQPDIPAHGSRSAVLRRRAFLQAAGMLVGGLLCGGESFADTSSVKIKEVRFINGKVVEIEAEDGTTGKFVGSSSQDRKSLQAHLSKIRELLVGRDPLDLKLAGETFWEAIYPGKARLFGEFRDPLTGELMKNKTRNARHTATGQVFIAFSTVDNALWDLRGKLRKQPAYQIMGHAHRDRVPVYWRPGEVGIEPAKAAKMAREAYDRGYRTQKWYFSKGAADGEPGFKANVELVRMLREELPEATLMLDNHTIRHSDDVEYSLRLCKAVAPYKPFWIEEPICPEHLDGYIRIKGETGLTIAGGEHWYTHWAVKPFLDHKCVDYVQSDPIWCGGISEWLRVCELVGQYPGVKVVPHITSPWVAAPHCVASQPESLCPILEFNSEGQQGGKQVLEQHMQRQPDGRVVMVLPQKAGLS